MYSGKSLRNLKLTSLFAKKSTSLFAKKPAFLFAKIPTFLFAKKSTLLFTVYTYQASSPVDKKSVELNLLRDGSGKPMCK